MTSRPGILIPAPLQDSLLDAIAAAFQPYRLWEADDRDSWLAEIAPQIRGMASNGKVTAGLIDALPNLEIIANLGVGVDGIDLEAARRRGITVTNTPGVLCDAVADFAIALLLAATRGVVSGDRYVRDHKWTGVPRQPLPLGTGLQGKICGIVGLGGIGRAVAKRAEAFGMQIRYHGPHVKPDVTHKFVPTLLELAGSADVLVLALPGSAETRHLVDKAVLDALGPEGILINVARGSIVDEMALVAALSEGRLGAAGLDVFENEPKVPAPLMGMDNVVLAPHIGSATQETRQAMADLVMENLTAHFSGLQPPTRVG